MSRISYRPLLIDQLSRSYDRDLAEYPATDTHLPFAQTDDQDEARALSLAWLKENPTQAVYITRVDDEGGPRMLGTSGGGVSDIVVVNCRVEIVEALFGALFRGYESEGLDAYSQFHRFSALYPEQVKKLVPSMHKSIFLNYPFWESRAFAPEAIDEDDREEVLAEIKTAWLATFPNTALGTPIRELSALIFQAITQSNIELVKACVRAGVDINQKARSNQVTALLLAIDQCQWPMVQEILDLGADPNLSGPDQLRPLAHAIRVSAKQARGGQSGISVEPSGDIVEVLLRSGANPELKGTQGKNAWRVAREHRHAAALRLFADAGYGTRGGVLDSLYRWLYR
jgi:hypothetical protein